LLVLATGLTNRAARLSRRRVDVNPFWPSLISDAMSGWASLSLAGGLLVLTAALVAPGIADWLRDGRVYLHWSRLLAGSFCLLSACQVLVFAVLMKVLERWIAERPAGVSTSSSVRASSTAPQSEPMVPA
jgi:hypothetical protein